MNEQIRQIAERIKEIREISGISAETMAERLGFPVKSIFSMKREIRIFQWDDFQYFRVVQC